MGFSQPAGYCSAIAAALRQYTDEDFARGENILDNSVTAGRAVKAVTGFDHLQHTIDLEFTAQVPGELTSGNPDSTGFRGLYLVLYMAEGEELEMDAGDYYLTSFMLVNTDNEVVFIAPIEDSDQAQFVSTPLPLWFSVFENEYTTVNPEVIDVRRCGCGAESFGYVAFGFNIIDCDEPLIGNYYRGIIDIEVTGLFDEFHVFILPNSDMYYYEGNLNNAMLAGFAYYFDGDMITEIVEGSHYLGKHSDSASVTFAIDNGILVEEWEDWIYRDVEPCGNEMMVRKNVLDFGLAHEPSEDELMRVENPDELRFRNFYGQNTTEILVCGQVYEYNNDRQSVIAAELIDRLFSIDEFLAEYDEELNIYW